MASDYLSDITSGPVELQPKEMLSLSLERYESCGDHIQHDPDIKQFEDDIIDFATETIVEA